MRIEIDQDQELQVPASAPEEFITKLEVSRRLGTRRRTVDEWMRRGILPYYKMGRVVRFKWSEVLVHLSRQCRVCHTLTKAGLSHQNPNSVN